MDVNRFSCHPFQVDFNSEYAVSFPQKRDSNCTREVMVSQVHRYMSQMAQFNVDEDKISNYGFYAIGLERWFKLWDRKQFLILDFSDVTVRTAQTMQRIASFLGIEPIQAQLPHRTPGRSEGQQNFAIKLKNISCSVVHHFANLHQPYVERLYKLLESTHKNAPKEQTRFKQFSDPQLECALK
jgi:hypothetical protein